MEKGPRIFKQSLDEARRGRVVPPNIETYLGIVTASTASSPTQVLEILGENGKKIKATHLLSTEIVATPPYNDSPRFFGYAEAYRLTTKPITKPL